jgi:hypothetical protein
MDVLRALHKERRMTAQLSASRTFFVVRNRLGRRCAACTFAAMDSVVRMKSANAAGPSAKASHAATPRRG